MKKKPMMPKAAKKMSMKSFEKSPMDKDVYKEGSKKDMAADKKALAGINKKK